MYCKYVQDEIHTMTTKFFMWRGQTLLTFRRIFFAVDKRSLQIPSLSKNQRHDHFGVCVTQKAKINVLAGFVLTCVLAGPHTNVSDHPPARLLTSHNTSPRVEMLG